MQAIKSKGSPGSFWTSLHMAPSLLLVLPTFDPGHHTPPSISLKTLGCRRSHCITGLNHLDVRRAPNLYLQTHMFIQQFLDTLLSHVPEVLSVQH